MCKMHIMSNKIHPSIHPFSSSQAEECFRESISIDPEFVPGLLLYGIICSNAEKFVEAEDFFEAAANIAPDSIVAHTMWGTRRKRER